MLPSEYQSFIHLSRYARWRDDLGRRETWEETVNRYINFWLDREMLDESNYTEIEEAILRLDVMPSMRCLMTAGEALDRDNVAGFNCSYLAINRVRAFDELMYVLMCGTGVGFSVERQFITNLPEVAEEMHDTDTTIVVADSKIGWATAYKELISALYSGSVPKWDTSKVRPAGARLKTFGGRASGPEPLEALFRFTVEVFKGARGRKLNSIECHDLVCKIADIVVVGGVRRSALISLSNLTDERMRHAKHGAWWENNSQRALANNSVCYTEKPDIGIFMKEWRSLYESKSGERGVYNREAARKLCPDRRDKGHDFGTNPCSEIVLRDRQFCNLSEVVVRSTDTLDDLKRKVRIAAILGTLQATLTDFRYLSSAWKKNTEEEALLGVSLTGIMDHPTLSGERFTTPRAEELQYWLQELKEVAVETNKEWANKLGIEQSMSVTCVKPSGTVSQLVDSASGIHPRYGQYYIRTVRADKKDPLAQFMVAKGFPVEDDVMKPDTGYVFSFPMKAPEGSVFRDDRNAIEQLELWKTYQLNWCEHKPSITVYVKEHEWMEVGAWVYENFDICSGVSFLPHSEHSYQQAPYQEIIGKTVRALKEPYRGYSQTAIDDLYQDGLTTDMIYDVTKLSPEEEYQALLSGMPNDVDWTEIADFEKEDMTTATHELACTAGACEIL